jgi:hypothetical protein
MPAITRMAVIGLFAKTKIKIMGGYNANYGGKQQQNFQVVPALFGKEKGNTAHEQKER